jgi:transposase InsO family protein
MFAYSRRPRIPLPKGWPASVQSAVIHTIALAHYAIVYTRGWATDSNNPRIRHKAEGDQATDDAAMSREQIRILIARIARTPAHQRSQYPPTERMAILELKAARGWSLEQTAKAFLVTAATVASWMNRLDEQGPDALVELRRPVNKFPEFVRYVVGRFKRLCPTMGKVKIAETLARAGLHLAATTVGRMIKESPRRPTPADDAETHGKDRIVTAKYPNHVWHVDLTVVPTGAGFWCPWLPFSLPQRWPFCWWVAVVVDHFSRRAMGVAAFKNQPTSEAVRGFLGRAVAKAKKPPKYIVCDRGKQFDSEGFRDWCRRKDIKPPRYGAIGQHGSIAVVERFILTMKTLLACLLLVPYRREKFQQELDAITEWYNQHRAHEWLGGRTPNEVYFGRFPANRKPRFEPRSRWPRGSPCAKPWALVRGSPGAKLTVEVSFYKGRRHLPIVRLKRAA